MQLPRALLGRALWRLLTEGVGAAPARATLERIVDDITLGRTAFHGLPRGFSLQLRSDVVLLEPPPPASDSAHDSGADVRATLFDDAGPAAERPLAMPGSVTLADGRVIEARLFDVAVRAPVSRSEFEVELDARLLAGPLVVRFPRAGDRFRGLGAPGSKPLARFLADAGVPRASRAVVPLVVAGSEIAWVAGIRPAARLRVTPKTTRRLVLSLVHAGLDRGVAAPGPRTPALPFDER
jgi:tRNA(Ile)-lysidine synthetase-like protein